MSTKIMLPILGESITDAVLSKWLKQPGDTVRTGDEIAELETSKATIALESPGSGVLLQVYCAEGATIETGQLLAIVGRPDEVIEINQPESAIPVAATPEISMPEAVSSRQFEPETSNQRVSPVARQLANKLGVDLQQVKPEKSGGRISSEDVQRYADARKPAATQGDGKTPFHRVELGNIRRVLAARMLESVHNIPQFSVSVDIEMDQFLRALDFHRQRLEPANVRPSLTALLAVCLVPALQKNPWVNGRYDSDNGILYDTINLAVAASTAQGLMAPVLFHIESLDLETISRQLFEKASRARQNSLTLEEITGSTFTLSNLGMHGVTQFVPLINPPQAAILGVGANRPVVLPMESGGTRHVSIMTCTLSADHRLLDGEMAARFLSTLKTEVENIRFD